MNGDEKVACRTPSSGRSGVTNIPKWKYDAVRAAIVQILSDAGTDGFPFSDLPGAVSAQLPKNVLNKLGSVGWHTTTVKLNLEVEGEIKRLSGVTPQRLVLA